jgi:D-glycero-alpha-D-manno-heptose 1-phosphate guanylyltransferase
MKLVLILVGGKGKRLKTVVNNCPKALAETNGIPFLEIQLRWLVAQGVKDVVLLTGFRSKQIKDFVGNGSKWGLNITCIKEGSPLDTGGALLNAIKELRIQEDFLLFNGDSLTEICLMDFCRETQFVKSVKLVAVSKEDAGRYGILEFDEKNNLIGFREKGNDSIAGWVNAGIYFFPAGWFNDLPTDIISCSLERDLIPKWLSESRLVQVFPVTGSFIDIGTPESLAKFKLQMKIWS